MEDGPDQLIFGSGPKRKQPKFTEADKQYFDDLSKNPLLYETLAHSLGKYSYKKKSRNF